MLNTVKFLEEMALPAGSWFVTVTPKLPADKHPSTTVLNYIVAHNLQ
jgi:hypothetical protein